MEDGFLQDDRFSVTIVIFQLSGVLGQRVDPEAINFAMKLTQSLQVLSNDSQDENVTKGPGRELLRPQVFFYSQTLPTKRLHLIHSSW